ncbi:MAG: HTH-type transcriptional regulator CysB [Gammaproteobacteria bacterium]
MKLQQLRYIREVARNNLNVSQAAQALFTSQPGVSKQIRALEAELGVDVFARHGKQLTHITEAGQAILRSVDEIVQRVDNIEAIAREFTDDRRGSLSIATTHTQSRYVLPAVISRFMERFPEISLHMHQGTPMQISELAANGTADFAIATEAMELFKDLVMLPCYSWNRVVLVPKSHPLVTETPLTLSNLNKYPLVTYTFGFTGRSKLDEAFQRENLVPKVVFTAADADVIKTYVRLGLGVGIVAKMAYDPGLDQDLVAVDASHLFEPSVTSIGFRRDFFFRSYMFDFIEMFAPHLEKELVQEASQMSAEGDRAALFRDLELPEQRGC